LYGPVILCARRSPSRIRIEFQHQPYLESFMRILIVEDDAALSSFIRKGLEAEHHAVDVANEGNQGRSMAMEFD
jgi:hypothetical protein